MDAQPDITRAFAAAAVSIDPPRSLDRSLQTLAEVAQHSVPGFDHASITLLHPGGRFETRGSTSPLARDLDSTQYALDEGPCLEAARGHGTVTSPRILHERRWPSYSRRAVAAGVRSQLSVRLDLGGEALAGGLNLYSTTSAHVSRESISMAEVFGTYAAVGERAASATAAPPGPALRSLDVLGQALALVMARLDMDADRAFDHLDASAAEAGLDVCDYSQRLVDQGDTR